jgi:hypothetical protein
VPASRVAATPVQVLQQGLRDGLCFCFSRPGLASRVDQISRAAITEGASPHNLSLSSRNTQTTRSGTGPVTQAADKILFVLSNLSFRQPLVEVCWMKPIGIDLCKEVARDIFRMRAMLIVINH